MLFESLGLIGISRTVERRMDTALSRVPPTPTASPTMPRKIPNAIPWANSDARKVLLGDIERNVFPNDMPILKAWESIYSKMETFKDVPYL